MPLVTTRLAAQLQRHTEAYTFTDAGEYIAQPGLSSLDEYGQPNAAAVVTIVACSFTDKPAVEKWQGYADVAEIAAEVRLSDVTPNKGAQFTITDRFGDSVTEQTFEIIGVQDRGAFGFVCALKAISL